MKKVDLHLFILLVLLIGFYCIYIENKHDHSNKYKIVNIDTFQDTGFSEDKLVNFMKTLNIKHSDIVLKQCKLETGNYTSDAFVNNHNLFGFMKGSKLRVYKDWKESVIHYSHWQNMNYKGGDYYQYLINIHYAEDSLYIKKLKSFK